MASADNLAGFNTGTRFPSGTISSKEVEATFRLLAIHRVPIANIPDIARFVEREGKSSKGFPEMCSRGVRLFFWLPGVLESCSHVNYCDRMIDTPAMTKW